MLRRRRRKSVTKRRKINKEEEEEEGLLTNNECRSLGTTRCRVALPPGARAQHRQRGRRKRRGLY